MYKIVELKHKKKIDDVEMPNFKDKNEELRWLRRQKRKMDMLDIKAIYIQYKDIKYMVHSKNRQLISLFLSVDFDEVDNEEKCAFISKFKHGNDLLIYSIINSDWLVNIDMLKSMSFEEIEIKCDEIRNEISLLKSKDDSYEIKNRIILLEYKLSTFTEYLEKNKTKCKSLTIN